MAIDAQSIASIGQNAPDIAGSTMKAYTLADAIDRRQLNQMTLQSTREEQADLSKIKTLSQQYDISNPEQRHELASRVQKEVGGKYAMDFMRMADEQDRRSAELSAAQMQNYQAKHEVMTNAILPMYQQIQASTQQGMPPGQIEAQLLPAFKQTLDTLMKQTLPNGEKVLNQQDIQQISTMLSGQPGALLSGINSAMASSRTAQEFFARQRKESLDERRVKALEEGVANRGRQGDERIDLARGKAAEGKGDALSEDAIKQAAERIVGGEPRSQVISGYGRGAQGAENIRKVDNAVAALMKGKSGTDITEAGISRAGEKRTELELSAREGKIATAVKEAQNFATIALDASAKVPRGQFLPWNKLSQQSSTQLQSPELASFKAATLSLVNAYTRAVGGGTVHVADKEHANEMLNTAQSPEAYQAVVNQLITETKAALAAPGQVRSQARGQTSTPGPASPTAAPSPAATGGAGGGTSQEITATGPNGQQLVLRNGQWVPK